MKHGKLYARTESTAMWSGGWLLDAKKDLQRERNEPIMCRRVRRQTLKEFQRIAGWFEADPEYYFVLR